MKPIVGVMPLWDDDKESIWMLLGYLDGLLEAGATPVILPMIEDENELLRLIEMCDGILLTGGHDVAPDLKVMAESEDGLVEALYMPSSRFFWAVQWHPEFSFRTDKNSKKIFKAFVDSMR